MVGVLEAPGAVSGRHRTAPAAVGRGRGIGPPGEPRVDAAGHPDHFPMPREEGKRTAMTDGEHKPDRAGVDRSEGFGERLLGVLLDRAHEMPPELIAPLLAEEVARVGGREAPSSLRTTNRCSWCRRRAET